MNWFSKNTLEIEPQEPLPVRLASDEFLSGLNMIAEMYERREKDGRDHASRLASKLGQSGGVSFLAREQLNHDLAELRDTISRANDMQAVAIEIRDWIRDYEYRGARPPYMPPLPPTPAKPYQGGE